MQRSASILDVPISYDGALEIARRSRGTPRLANRMLKRVRDWAQVRGNGVIDEDVSAQALSFFEVDRWGWMRWIIVFWSCCACSSANVRWD